MINEKTRYEQGERVSLTLKSGKTIEGCLDYIEQINVSFRITVGKEEYEPSQFKEKVSVKGDGEKDSSNYYIEVEK